ncbi:MAG TPA: cupredoxin domain-containing protein [Mycobacteriales bacterium]|nr:cupredoxin domain-containing protein [Mycobacteriales bacterium]
MNRTIAAAAALLLLAAGCGGSDDEGSALKVTGTVTASGAPASQTVRLDMTDSLTFLPNVVNAKVGSLAVTVENAGAVPHNLVFDDTALGKTGTVKGHATATLTVPLAKAGTFVFTCTFHSGMDGQVVVTG